MKSSYWVRQHKRLTHVKPLKQTQQRDQGFIASQESPCFHALVDLV